MVSSNIPPKKLWLELDNSKIEESGNPSVVNKQFRQDPERRKLTSPSGFRGLSRISILYGSSLLQGSIGENSDSLPPVSGMGKGFSSQVS